MKILIRNNLFSINPYNFHLCLSEKKNVEIDDLYSIPWVKVKAKDSNNR